MHFSGNFTPEVQQKMKIEEERQAKLDPWKVSHNFQCCIMLHISINVHLGDDKNKCQIFLADNLVYG